MHVHVEEHHAVARERRPGRRVHHCATTKREHAAGLVECSTHRGPLQLTEACLPFVEEDLPDRHAGGSFHVGVGVAEVHSEPCRDDLTDRRLAGPRRPDEHDDGRHAVLTVRSVSTHSLRSLRCAHGSRPWLSPSR